MEIPILQLNYVPNKAVAAEVHLVPEDLAKGKIKTSGWRSSLGGRDIVLFSLRVVTLEKLKLNRDRFQFTLYDSIIRQYLHLSRTFQLP